MYQFILTRPDGSRETRRFPSLPVTVGRAAPGSPPPDLDLPDPAVSREQAEIRSAVGGVEIRPRGPNQIFVNGQPVYGSAPLRPGDAVRIGPYVLVFTPEEKSRVSPTVALAGGPAASAVAPAPGRRRAVLVFGLGAAVLLALGAWRWQEQRKNRRVLVVNSRDWAARHAPPPAEAASLPPAIPVPAPAAAESLRQEVRQGLQLWKDRDLDPGNRYRAWQACRAAARRCSTAALPRSAADSLLEKNDILVREIDSLYLYHRRQGDIAAHQGNAAAARRHWEYILRLIPDREDTRHRWARGNLAAVRGSP